VPISSEDKNQPKSSAHLAAILGAVGGTWFVIIIAIVGVILVLIVVKRRKPQHLDTNEEGIRMDFVHA
jgi:uncharacterized membrane protein